MDDEREIPEAGAGFARCEGSGVAPTVGSMKAIALEEEIPMTATAFTVEPIFDLDELLREIERYLAAVDAFREEGLEPHWT
jgi:hypothetical protein